MGKLLLSALSIAVLAGCSSPTSAKETTTAAERAARSFSGYAAGIEEKESVTKAPTAHVLVDTALAPSGSTFTLWVTDPSVTGIRSRCYYLDEATASGYSGTGGCGGQSDEPASDLSLSGNDDLLVGTVSSPATWVRITAGPDRLSVPVVGGYFLVPPQFTDHRDDALTFTLLGADGAELGTTTTGNKAGVTPLRAKG